MSPPDQRKLRLGVAGLGRAFSVMLPTFTGDARVSLVAAADPRAEARQRFAMDFGASAYESVEELCADSAVDAVYDDHFDAEAHWSIPVMEHMTEVERKAQSSEIGQLLSDCQRRLVSR